MLPMTATINISLPKPYPLQQAIIRHPAKRKVVCAGRRAGKTTLAAMLAIERILDGQKVLLTSTSQDQADAFWEKAKLWLADVLVTKYAYKNETRRIIQIGKGRIRVKTGSNADVLRGGDEDLIVFDECALLDPDVWQAVGAPMLADRDGDAIFISTPMRKNWFYHLYQSAITDERDRWQAWHFTTHSNPFLSPIAIEELTHDMPENMYRQEILAEFLESDGQVFRNIRECVGAEDDKLTASRYVFGVDWAQVNDYTAIVVFDVQRRRVVEIDRFRGVDWSLQRGRLHTLYKKWEPVNILAEANAMGSPNIEALQKEGLPVQPFMTTAQSKPPLIENLVLDFERGNITIPNDPILIGELESYERTVSPATGRSTYSAPAGLHDDCVIALALAVWSAQRNTTYNVNELADLLSGYRGQI